MIPAVAILVAAYLAGAVPFAYLLPRWVAGVDVRLVGSGNVGATNVLRVTTPALAAAVTILDVAKGAAAVWGATVAGTPGELPVAAGVAAVLGHLYPVWLGFRGGKGVATACGALGVLAPLETGAAALVFAATAWLTRYVSAGSLAAAVFLPAALWWRGHAAPALLAASVLTAGLVILRHRSNIARLRAGTERRLGERG